MWPSWFSAGRMEGLRYFVWPVFHIRVEETGSSKLLYYRITHSTLFELRGPFLLTRHIYHHHHLLLFRVFEFVVCLLLVRPSDILVSLGTYSSTTMMYCPYLPSHCVIGEIPIVFSNDHTCTEWNEVMSCASSTWKLRHELRSQSK